MLVSLRVAEIDFFFIDSNMDIRKVVMFLLICTVTIKLPQSVSISVNRPILAGRVFAYDLVSQRHSMFVQLWGIPRLRIYFAVCVL